MESDSLISPQSPVIADAISRHQNGLVSEDDAKNRQELLTSVAMLTSSDDDDDDGDIEDDKWSSDTEMQRLNGDQAPDVAIRDCSNRASFADTASGAR
jgi:hypothetical protein